MSGVASKNPYDLLGNDLEDDAPPAPPVQPVDKTQPRTGKRNTNGDAPPRAAAQVARGGRGGRRQANVTGSELAIRDRQAGSRTNRERPIEEGARDDKRGGRIGRGDPRDRRGARGARDDRHSRSGIGPNDHAKQAAHGWGDDTAQGELQDERAGEAIAAADEKAGEDSTLLSTDADGNAVAVSDAAIPEPEDKSKSYADYLAEQQEKRAALGGNLKARQPNDGGKKFGEGTAVVKEEDEYIPGAAARAKRERERKEKNVVKLDHDIQARERESPRGGRGGRGRGRGDGPFRGGERGRGEGRGRGGRGRGEGRGEFRGARGRGRGGPSPNLSDTSAFPSLGA